MCSTDIGTELPAPQGRGALVPSSPDTVQTAVYGGIGWHIEAFKPDHKSDRNERGQDIWRGSMVPGF